MPPQTILQPREEAIDVRAAGKRGQLDRRENCARVFGRFNEELAVVAVAPRVLLDERLRR